MKNNPRPIVLVSMDGVGVAPQSPGNAVVQANTPTLDMLWPTFPHTYLEASGLNVGLPSGTDGNSEVGHMTMGSGRVIFQNLPRIDDSISKGTFFENEVFKQAFTHAKGNKSNVHLIGLVGSGFVHSSVDHLLALIKLASDEKLDQDKLLIHAFTDGRDSPNNTANELLEKVESYCFQKKVGRIASIVGRAYAMDRNRNWARTKIAYDMLTEGKGETAENFTSAIEALYKKSVFDEYLEPTLFPDKNGKLGTVNENDAIIFFNFRPDRAVQLTMAFEDENFKGFERQIIKNLYFAGMADYENGFPKNKIFPQEKVTTPLGKVLSDNGLKQLRVAESEKFPHVTYFFNGQNKEIYPGETWLEIPSPKDVSTYDQKPEMSQKWIADVVAEKIRSDEFDFILVNFAGPDMVGHTGNLQATIAAMEACDEALGVIVDATFKQDGIVIVTSDHGNAEELINMQTGHPDTKHSTNPVPLIIADKRLPARELTVGGLADVAPTILGLIGISQPQEMTGRNLLD